MNYNKHLASVREAMKSSLISAYIIPSADPHLGENVPDHWRIIRWLTGFTGSAGTVVITEAFAGLWTDSRYTIQASSQLNDSEFEAVNPFEKKDYITWISANIPTGGRIALDGRIFSIEQTRRLAKLLDNKSFSFDFNCDLITDIWTERPALPHSVAFDHATFFSGKGRTEKIAAVRRLMKDRNIDFQLLTCPDDIMWLLNIRGGDSRYSPLILSFAIVGEEQILLFLDETKVPLKISAEFDRQAIVILPYEETAGIISSLSPDSSILLNPVFTSENLYQAIPTGMNRIEDINTTTRLKAIKNEVEIAGIRNAMIKDGIALTRFFFWIENNMGKENLTELSLSEKLDNLRSQNENYLCPSFESIVAFNEHGALPHYIASSETNSPILDNGILLVDSGSQYLDGTTDITRTIPIGAPTPQQKRDYTLVLKGTIDLAMAGFPSGTKGFQLDMLARRSLWENGLNYGHGTGHGVGFCLNVHEGPQSIGPGFGQGTKTILEAGMLTSDEPAVYREGEYGIRIENLILCCNDNETQYGQFLKFETMSLCYIDKTLIDISLLDKKEIDWLNSYHSNVYDKLNPYLSSEENEWLKKKTSAI
jgi:Xaa-Pro aminopeptidase